MDCTARMKACLYILWKMKQADGSIFMPNLSLEHDPFHALYSWYEKMFGSDFQLKTEAYYQHINNLPVPTNPDKYWAPIYGGVNPGDTLANIGEGRNYGLELTLQKFFTKSYYFLFSSSLFDSKYKPADGHWYDTKFNLGFINNLVGGRNSCGEATRMIG